MTLDELLDAQPSAALAAPMEGAMGFLPRLLFAPAAASGPVVGPRVTTEEIPDELCERLGRSKAEIDGGLAFGRHFEKGKLRFFVSSVLDRDVVTFDVSTPSCVFLLLLCCCCCYMLCCTSSRLFVETAYRLNQVRTPTRLDFSSRIFFRCCSCFCLFVFFSSFPDTSKNV